MFAQTLLATLLAATSFAAPAPAVEQRAEGDRFSLIALRSTSPVHLQSLNANGNAFYVGRPTATSCPSTVTCPADSDTNLVVGADGRLIMDAIVPGGQTVYIDQFGVLRFTAAHTGGSTPEKSILDGWTYAPPAEGQVIGFLTHGADEILACAARDGGYLIFVKYSHDVSTPEDCISISLGAAPFDGDAAWQYV